MSEIPRHEELSVAALGRMDEACDRFEDAWIAGTAPCLEDFLGDSEGAEREELLNRLLRLELEYRRRAGQNPTAKDYHQRLPGYASLLEVLFATEVHAGGTGPAVTEPTPAEEEDVPSQAGRYRIEGELGRGGMGLVLSARDPDLDRPLAVKVLLLRYHGDATMERRFREEARLTGQLQHPSVPPVHEVGRLDDGRPYFAMKLIRGRTLAELLKQRPTPSEGLPDLQGVFKQVCQAIAYAHSQGVIHPDLKPANVMVGAFGEVQVMDWGLAKVLRERPAEAVQLECNGGLTQMVGSGSTAEESQAGTVAGTLGYMAPEQARGEAQAVDERADVFGLGAILSVLLTGRLPFRGNPEAVLRASQRGNLGDAFARPDDCGADAELVLLCKECLAAVREERQRHAGVVAERVAGGAGRGRGTGPGGGGAQATQGDAGTGDVGAGHGADGWRRLCLDAAAASPAARNDRAGGG